jgi:hypothetical protein
MNLKIEDFQKQNIIERNNGIFYVEIIDVGFSINILNEQLDYIIRYDFCSSVIRLEYDTRGQRTETECLLNGVLNINNNLINGILENDFIRVTFIDVELNVPNNASTGA